MIYYRIFFALIIIFTIIFHSILKQDVSHSIWKTNQGPNNDNPATTRLQSSHDTEKFLPNFRIITNNSFALGSINDSVQANVLVVYVYAVTHSQASGNLAYFIKHAVRENDGADYYFILQNLDNKTVNENELPILSKRNAHYIQHENLCFDLGSLGWFIKTYTVGNPWINQITANQTEKINITQYKYFILINSSVRGPFFPPYYLKFVSDYKEEYDKSFYWYYVFTKRLNEKVKLTGCTISCIPIPHVQSYVLVTDFVGLKILLEPSGIFGPEGVLSCHPQKHAATYHGEIPTSTRILESGYMIDCVLTKYQGIDFTKEHNKMCNQWHNPYLESNLDGTQIEPYESVFLKYNDTPETLLGRKRCELFERWMEDALKQNRSIW